MSDLLYTVPAAVGVVLGAAFAVLVWRADPDGAANRRLTALLAVDTLFFAYLASSIWYAPSVVAHVVLLNVIATLDGVAHVLFVATLETPIARLFRGARGFRALLALWLIASVTAPVFFWRLRAQGVVLTEETIEAYEFGWLVLAAGSLIALAASLDAFRRTARGTSAHRRARWLAIAFGTRDAMVGIGVLSWGLAYDLGLEAGLAIAAIVISASLLVFIPLLAYGILQSQLFDIDLRIKWGISRGTVAGVILVAVFVGAKIVENYLNRTAGFVAGSTVAGVLLFLVPKLNKIGEKVANTAMPQVRPTPAYLAFKKIEVYKAALEAAHETGGMTDKERASLDRLREKLGLAAEDTQAIEAELAAAR